MTANKNEGCVGWLLEIFCLMGEEIKLLIAKDLNLLSAIFLKGEMSIFLALG